MDELDLDFRHMLILIFFNERKYTYNSYDIVKLLSLDYDSLRILIDDLLFLELIQKDVKSKKHVLTEVGEKLLKERNLNSFDLESLINNDFDIIDNKIPDFRENIFYFPKRFKL